NVLCCCSVVSYGLSETLLSNVCAMIQSDVARLVPIVTWDFTNCVRIVYRRWMEGCSWCSLLAECSHIKQVFGTVFSQFFPPNCEFLRKEQGNSAILRLCSPYHK